MALFRGYDDLIRVAGRFLESFKTFSASKAPRMPLLLLLGPGKWPE